MDNSVDIVGNWLVLDSQHFDCVGVLLLCGGFAENILSFLDAFG